MAFFKTDTDPENTYLIVGLGNPGQEYAQTRHNVGFQTLDALEDRTRGGVWKTQKGALVKETTWGDKTLVLAKPQSFMNLSGKPVSQLLKEYKLSPDHLVVIHDDLDLPEGSIRLKAAGGHGGHNGLRSLIDMLGTRDWPRIRIGIGRPPGSMDPAKYVLEVPRKDTQELLAQTTEEASEAALSLLEVGLEKTQQEYHSRGK